MRGGSIISTIARLHGDGPNIPLFHPAGHNSGDLLSAIENMNQTDWGRLRHDNAFRSDPTLRRISKPETDSDRSLRHAVENVVHNALANTMLPPGEVDRHTQTLLNEGRLPLDTMAYLQTAHSAIRAVFQDFGGVQKAIMGAGAEEKQRLLSAMPQDRAFRDRVFQGLSTEQQAVIVNGLKQGRMDLADRIRSFVLGDGTESADLKAPLQELKGDPGKIQALKNEYFTKYNRALDADLLGQLRGRPRCAWGRAHFRRWTGHQIRY